jgi:hypothetical protein
MKCSSKMAAQRPLQSARQRGVTPIIQTEHFDVFYQFVVRNPEIGKPRHVFSAWYREEDIPRSVCEITIFTSRVERSLPVSNFVEWIHVCEHFRRSGIATEVLRAVESLFDAPLELSGVTRAGKAFCKSYLHVSAERQGPETDGCCR